MRENETAGYGLDDGGDESHLAQILLGGRMRRRRKLAGLALAQRILENEGAEDEGEDDGSEERRLARLILAGGLARRRRRRRLAALAMARKIRSRDEDYEVEGEDDDEGGEEDRLARLILAGGLARRRRLAGLTQSELMWGPYHSLSKALLQTQRNFSAFTQINRRLVDAFLGIARREQESVDEILESAIAGIRDFGQAVVNAQVHSIDEFQKHAREAVSSGDGAVIRN